MEGAYPSREGGSFSDMGVGVTHVSMVLRWSEGRDESMDSQGHKPRTMVNVGARRTIGTIHTVGTLLT